MGKDCCNPKTTKIKGTKKIDPFLMWVVVITIGVLLGVVLWGTKMGASPKVAIDKAIEMVINSKNFDWGEIDYDKGVVSKSFEIKNAGSGTLELYNVLTSCMCTTAQLITPSVASKKFGMHEKSSSVFEVKPGETAELKVEFDPAFHGPSGVGPVTRTVTMQTNSATEPNLSFELTGTVVKK